MITASSSCGKQIEKRHKHCNARGSQLRANASPPRLLPPSRPPPPLHTHPHLRYQRLPASDQCDGQHSDTLQGLGAGHTGALRELQNGGGV